MQTLRPWRRIAPGASGAVLIVMMLRLVTCPETVQLETIGYEDTPLGMVIDSCSRFRPGPVVCPGTCAARLDRREQLPFVIEVKSLLGSR